MKDLFRGREIGCIGGGGSRRDWIYRGGRREQRQIRTGRRINTEQERPRKRRQVRTEGRAYYGSKLIQ